MADQQVGPDTQLEAVAHNANPTAVAAGANASWHANRAGIPFVIGGHPNVISRMAEVADADNAQTDTALITIAGGSKIVITRISVMASNANTVDVAFRCGFGATTLPALPGVTGTDDFVAAHPAIAPGSGFVEGNGSGILGVGADGEDFRYTCGDPTSGAIFITVSYYTIES